MKKCTVRTIYKKDDNFIEQEYPLDVYCNDIKKNILKALELIEKEMRSHEWNKQSETTYSNIRSRLLNAANNAIRIPANMMVDNESINSKNLSDFIADKIK